MDDLIKNFKKVPNGYGEVAFYWWLGDKLTKERLSWQLEKLKDHAISGIQINYAHTDKGGALWGLTIESDPPLFSEDWWELFEWYMKECQKYGISLSLSDYTLGSAGQGWFVDELLENNPDKIGQILEYIDGEIKIKKIKDSFNPIHKGIGDAFVNVFYKRFEERFPEECGKGLNFFFSDELNFNIRGNLWCDDFKEQFIARKEYDITPYLNGIFEDIGDITPKIRLDYYDVIVTLSEERFFKPVYQFHEDRNMIFGCDHGGRGKDIIEFGDYFRTMKWNQGPGNDQPFLESDIIKNKVSSSIAHLYQRPRTWLEGFYGSGWGTSSEDLTDATFRNFAMGHNLLTLHGLYYSTYGGWWEWAPPCNHFRMPYWPHLSEFLKCTERLSYLLSQGVHVCDVAIVYPVATMESCREEGINASNIAFKAAEYFYSKGLDFDFIDFESIEKAEIVDSELKVSGESYKVLVLPAMKSVRYGMMKKVHEFQQAGGVVICIGERPKASDSKGRHDDELDSLSRSNVIVDTVESAYDTILLKIDQDFIYDNIDQNDIYFLHRRVGSKDIYMVYGVSKGDVCRFRSTGSIEVWNPWTTQMHALSPIEQSGKYTSIQMPLNKDEAHIIVFDSDIISEATPWKERKLVDEIQINGKWGFELKPTMDNTFGDFRLPATKVYIGAEARNMSYRREGEDWQRISCGYGPKFLKMGPISESNEIAKFENDIIGQLFISCNDEFYIDKRPYKFKEYQYSERMGVEGDPGHQGYHGLKGEMSDEFLVMGKAQWTRTSTEYLPEEGEIYYFWSSVNASEVESVNIRTSEFKPSDVWINGIKVEGNNVTLQAGSNTILLKYKGTGRSYFILEAEQTIENWQQEYPLSMHWFEKPGVYTYDILPQVKDVIGQYQFQSPPALSELVLSIVGDAEVKVDGRIVESELVSEEEALPEPEPEQELTENRKYIKKNYIINNPKKEESLVEIKILHENGFYGGSAFTETIKMNCGKGVIDLGDWSLNEGLYSYSGGAYYTKNIMISKEQLHDNLILCLGDVVSSAEVKVNGKKVGIKVAPSWEFDITEYVVEGENEVEILVYNTLSNHYTSIPTRYRGNLKSGLIGPVEIKVYLN